VFLALCEWRACSHQEAGGEAGDCLVAEAQEVFLRTSRQSDVIFSPEMDVFGLVDGKGRRLEV